MDTLKVLKMKLAYLDSFPPVIYVEAGPNDWSDTPDGIKYILDKSALQAEREGILIQIKDVEQGHART